VLRHIATLFIGQNPVKRITAKAEFGKGLIDQARIV
jgi:hypothetical protein